MDATAELSAAHAAKAELYAPFELVAAEAYLEKAREEQSYADFQTAVRFAKKSRLCAEAARRLALQRAKESFGATASDDIERRPDCRPGPDRGPGTAAFDREEIPPLPVAPAGTPPPEPPPGDPPGQDLGSPEPDAAPMPDDTSEGEAAPPREPVLPAGEEPPSEDSAR